MARLGELLTMPGGVSPQDVQSRAIGAHRRALAAGQAQGMQQPLKVAALQGRSPTVNAQTPPPSAGMSPLQKAALATSTTPILGDVLGLTADAEMYATDPSSRTPLNFALTGLGALPFVPSFAGIMAGKGAKTADLTKLARAQEMAAAGAHRSDIWQETGWFRAPDGQWKFEIDDTAAKAMVPRHGWRPSASGKALEAPLGDVWDHPELYRAYPNMRNVPVRRVPQGQMGSYQASFTPQPGPVRAGMEPGRIDIRDVDVPKGADPRLLNEQQVSLLAHESQHGVQTLEPEFATGGNWSEFRVTDKAIAEAKGHEEATALGARLAARLRAAGVTQVEEIEPGSVTERVMDAFGKAHNLDGNQLMNALFSVLEGDARIPDKDALRRLRMQRRKEVEDLVAEQKSGTKAYQDYLSLAGETEARMVQKRLELGSPEANRMLGPWENYDVPESVQWPRRK